MGSVDPLRISVDEERHAVALAQELIGISNVDLHPERDRWVVSLRAGHTNNLVVRVLDAVRRSLARANRRRRRSSPSTATSTRCKAHS